MGDARAWAGAGALLGKAYDEVWARFTGRLGGLADQEYFWEPVPGGWSIRQDGDGRWRIDGEGGGGPAPDPVPVSTIAWRLAHIGLTFIVFGDRLFADGTFTLDDVVLPSSADAARDFLDRAYRDWCDRLASIGQERWGSPIGPRFGAYAENSTADLVLHTLDELIHHAAEVGLLRDLYLYREALAAP